MSDPSPSVMRVGSTELLRADMLDHDPRGLIWMYEPPRSNAHYVLGADPSVGITGWDRTLRSKDDVKTDNAAVEVIRKGTPDVQVAEFAAPIDAYELAKVINFLGRMYCGANEDGQALACIEMNIGWATQTELINKYGYMNLPPWRLESGLTPHITKKYGWYSSRSTRKDLWIKGMRHINSRAITINSAPLVEEMTDCTWDNFLSMDTARAIYGAHDDRVVALLIAIWYCVPTGTQVTLASGLTASIEHVRIGDLVRGRYHDETVVGVFSCWRSGVLCVFRISGTPHRLSCTPEHKVLVQRQREKRSARKSRNIAGSALEWLPAREVKKGHRLLVPAKFDLPLCSFTPDQLYIMGWYLAEGFVHRYEVSFTLGLHEQECAERLRDLLNVWMLEQKPYRGSGSRRARIRKARTSLVVSVNSPMLSSLFLEHLGTGSKTKRLSPYLYNSTGLEPLIRGWCAGDGSHDRAGWRVVTTSSNLVKQMRQVLLNHGIWCTYDTRMMPERKLEGRTLPPTEFHTLRFSDGWSTGHSSSAGLRRQRVSIVPEGFLTPVTQVREIPYEGLVHDIETSEHSFVAEGVTVHNCHEWSLEWAPTETAAAAPSNLPDYQATAMTVEDVDEEFNERVASHWQW